MGFSGKNTGVGCHFLLQDIFPTQGWRPGLQHCRLILYHLSHQGSPKVKEKVTQLCLTLCDPMDYIVHGIFQARIVEWVAVPFSRTSSQPRYQTHVSSIAGRFFTSWGQEDVSGIPSSCVRGIGKCPLGGKISWLRTTGLIPSYLLRELAVLLIPFSFPLPSTSTPLNSYCFKKFLFIFGCDVSLLLYGLSLVSVSRC